MERNESKADSQGRIVVPGAKKAERTIRVPKNYEGRIASLYAELVDHAYLLGDLLDLSVADVESVVDSLALDQKIRALKLADDRARGGSD